MSKKYYIGLGVVIVLIAVGLYAVPKLLEARKFSQERELAKQYSLATTPAQKAAIAAQMSLVAGGSSGLQASANGGNIGMIKACDDARKQLDAARRARKPNYNTIDYWVGWISGNCGPSTMY